MGKKVGDSIRIFMLAGICIFNIFFHVEAAVSGEAAQGDVPQEIYVRQDKRLEDYEPIRDVISVKVTLDEWGTVNLVSLVINELHPTMLVVLADDDGNILFEFWGSYMGGPNSYYFDEFVEDMDGDGLKDIKVITGFSGDYNRYEQDYYQMPDGGFSERRGEGESGNSGSIKADRYRGYYRIAEFLPSMDYREDVQGIMPRQEVDMMIGRIVVMEDDFIVMYDCERRKGLLHERSIFNGNYMIERFMERQLYWKRVIPDSLIHGTVPDYVMEQAVGKERYEKISGVIESTDIETVRYYTMEGTDDLIMESSVSGQYFLLEKLWGEEAAKARKQTGEWKNDWDTGRMSEEGEAVLKQVRGTYTVKGFLPTRYYEGKADALLQDGEPEWMIGKKITIGEDVFTTYDNYRWSDAGREKEAGKWFQNITIQEPDYRLMRRERWEIFGLGDDGMLPEDMEQEEYMEISVYPGIKMGDDRYLPQLYLLDDGRILMYSMGQYFLLEKTGGRE